MSMGREFRESVVFKRRALLGFGSDSGLVLVCLSWPPRMQEWYAGQHARYILMFSGKKCYNVIDCRGRPAFIKFIR